MHKIIYFFQKKIIKKTIVCLLYLKFSDPLPENTFFYLALVLVQLRKTRPEMAEKLLTGM